MLILIVSIAKNIFECKEYISCVLVATMFLTTSAAKPSHSPGSCDPPHIALTDDTTPKAGRIAWEKCLEYQDLVYPCESGLGVTLRRSRCQRDFKGIPWSPEAFEHEFPHLVRLGTTDEEGKDEWIASCAGALISDTFVLTTAHCTKIRGTPVTRVVLESNVTHIVETVIQHPGYRPPARWNDIALLKLHKSVQLDQFTVPACLPVDVRKEIKGIIAGWDLAFKNSERLQRFRVRQQPMSVCISSLPPQLTQKAIGGHQMCFQDLSNSTILGSGDILQIENRNLHCMYSVVGLGSFAQGFGPGVYTDLEAYVDWIEDVVWK